jgi:hypothetical protein
MSRPGYAKLHPLIKETARECAGAFFDNMDVFNDARVERTEQFRISETNQKLYINKHWPEFVKVARKALAARLGMPGLTPGEQEQIYDALVSDHGLRTDEQMVAPSIMRLN